MPDWQVSLPMPPNEQICFIVQFPLSTTVNGMCCKTCDWGPANSVLPLWMFLHVWDEKMSSIRFMTSSNIHKYYYYHPTACTFFPIKDLLVNLKGRHAGWTPFVNVNGFTVLISAMSLAFVSSSKFGWIKNSLIRSNFV